MMDPVRNPYSPGAGSPPPALVGRDFELKNFDVAVQRLALGRSAKSLMLTGLRGVGKTVLLREFGRIALGHGWIHQHIEATERLDFPEAIGMLVRKAVLRLSARKRVTSSANRALAALKSFQLKWQLGVGTDLTIGLDPIAGLADSGILDDDLAELFLEVGVLAREQGTGVLFTVDEIQYLHRDHFAALILALHRVSQEQLPLLVAGAGLPSLPGLAGEAKSYAERLFTFAVIDSLTVAEAGEALVGPAQEEGTRWHADALRTIVDATDGYPYFLQEFGKQAWDIASEPDQITSGDAQAAIPIAIDELDTGFFRVRIDRATNAERDYLRAMASLGAGPYQSGDVAAAMGKSTSQVGPNRDTLIKRGLCYSPRHGVIAFTVPLFDRYVRRQLDRRP